VILGVALVKRKPCQHSTITIHCKYPSKKILPMKEATTLYPTPTKKAIAMVSLSSKDLVEIQAKGLLSELYDINQILLVSLRV